MTELKSRGAPRAGTAQSSVSLNRSPPGSSGQKARAEATLGGTPSSESHAGVFLRKAEISNWQQWFFSRQHLETYQQKQNIGKGEEKEMEELWELQMKFILFPLW